jgi:hypothetical protein
VIAALAAAGCVAVTALVIEVRRLRAFVRDVKRRWRHAFMGS